MSNRFRLNDEHGNECDQFATLDGVCAALARAFRGAESVADLNNLLSMEVVEVEEPSQRERRGQVISRALDLGIGVDLRNGRITLRGDTWSCTFEDAEQVDGFVSGYESGVVVALGHSRRPAEPACEHDHVWALGGGCTRCGAEPASEDVFDPITRTYVKADSPEGRYLRGDK